MKAISFINTWKQLTMKAEAFCGSCTRHASGGSHGQVAEEPWYPDILPAYEGELFCLLLKNSWEQWSLCLVPTGNTPSEYRRVGICMWRAHNYNGWKSGDRFLDVASPERRRGYKPTSTEWNRPFLYPEAWTETLTIV